MIQYDQAPTDTTSSSLISMFNSPSKSNTFGEFPHHDSNRKAGLARATLPSGMNNLPQGIAGLTGFQSQALMQQLLALNNAQSQTDSSPPSGGAQEHQGAVLYQDKLPKHAQQSQQQQQQQMRLFHSQTQQQPTQQSLSQPSPSVSQHPQQQLSHGPFGQSAMDAKDQQSALSRAQSQATQPTTSPLQAQHQLLLPTYQQQLAFMQQQAILQQQNTAANTLQRHQSSGQNSLGEQHLSQQQQQQQHTPPPPHGRSQERQEQVQDLEKSFATGEQQMYLDQANLQSAAALAAQQQLYASALASGQSLNNWMMVAPHMSSSFASSAVPTATAQGIQWPGLEGFQTNPAMSLLAGGGGGGGALLPQLATKRSAPVDSDSDITKPKKRKAEFTSRHKGVTWHKRDRKWIARVWIPSLGRVQYLGTFFKEDEAHQAIQDKQRELTEARVSASVGGSNEKEQKVSKGGASASRTDKSESNSNSQTPI